MTQKQRAWLFFGLLTGMITFILEVFYLSEPKYIDNVDGKNIEKYDLIATGAYGDLTNNESVDMGLVLQVNPGCVLIKDIDRSWRENKIIDPSQVKSYRIVGKGTIYHKINNYVGFNIMVITQVLIGICLGLLIITQTRMLAYLLD